jgi:uncharacterized protein
VKKGRPAFWDASALVPLCVAQPATVRARALYDQYDAVVWWATPVEIASALARLVRMKQLSLADATSSRRLTKVLADEWSVIEPSYRLRGNAEQCVNRFELRASDAFQLAAAIEWGGDLPQSQVFITLDERLREAATLSGFDALPLD